MKINFEKITHFPRNNGSIYGEIFAELMKQGDGIYKLDVPDGVKAEYVRVSLRDKFISRGKKFKSKIERNDNKTFLYVKVEDIE